MEKNIIEKLGELSGQREFFMGLQQKLIDGKINPKETIDFEEVEEKTAEEIGAMNDHEFQVWVERNQFISELKKIREHMENVSFPKAIENPKKLKEKFNEQREWFKKEFGMLVSLKDLKEFEKIEHAEKEQYQVFLQNPQLMISHIADGLQEIEKFKENNVSLFWDILPRFLRNISEDIIKFRNDKPNVTTTEDKLPAASRSEGSPEVSE